MSAWSHNEYLDSEYGSQYRDKGPFPSVSDQIDRLNLNSDDANSDLGDDDVRVVEEIESLCMNCEENVRSSSCCSLRVRNSKRCAHPGYHTTPFDQDPIFS